jgi:hypothetical protein
MTGPIAYGLLGFFGAGALLGAMVLPLARAALSMEAIISIVTATFGTVIRGRGMLNKVKDQPHAPKGASWVSW